MSTATPSKTRTYASNRKQDPWPTLPAPKAPEPLSPVGEPVQIELTTPADSPLVAELRGSVGRAGLLRGPAASIANLMQEFAGTGAFARTGFIGRAIVITVDAAPNGLWDARVMTPGNRERDAQMHVVTSGQTPVAWVRDLVEGARATADSDLLVLLGDGCSAFLPWAELEQLAADAQSIVAVLDPATVELAWEPHDAVEPNQKPEPALIVQPPVAIEPKTASVPERELVSVASELAARGYPESVWTLNGHRIDVAYITDEHGRLRHVEFRGFADQDGRLVELEVESGEGQRTPISERKFGVQR